MPCHPLFLNDDAGKYDVPANEGDILPNKPGYTTVQEIERAEFVGFFEARYDAIEALTSKTRFNLKFLLHLHKKALEDLYTFAGKIRTVNMSKGGFTFPSALFLPQALKIFEQEMLLPLNNTYTHEDALLRDMARMHAELLFIHPFREGNGRIVRLLTELIYLQHTGQSLNFEVMLRDKDRYIFAVQMAACQNYTSMEELFRELVPE